MPTKKTTNTVDYTKFTYNICADNCSHTPRIEYERDGLSFGEAKKLFETLTKSFRRVDLVCGDTGELCASNYYSDEFFTVDISPQFAIDVAEQQLNNMR